MGPIIKCPLSQLYTYIETRIDYNWCDYNYVEKTKNQVNGCQAKMLMFIYEVDGCHSQLVKTDNS